MAAVLDKAIQSHPRDRFATATEMLQALKTDVGTIPPTVPYIHTETPRVQPPNIASTPQVQTQLQAPTIVDNPGMKDWQKATIIGSVIGVCIMASISIINKQPPEAVQATTVLTGGSQNNSVLQPTASSITREAAISVLNRWQEAKRELFAPPFNRSLGADLTTGEAYRKNIGADSSLEWLANNNSYYRYGVQKIDSIENFAASNDRATIEILMTEDRKFYQNGKIVSGDNTSFDTRLVRYSLQLENGKLKISDYETIKVISSR